MLLTSHYISERSDVWMEAIRKHHRSLYVAPLLADRMGNPRNDVGGTRKLHNYLVVGSVVRLLGKR